MEQLNIAIAVTAFAVIAIGMDSERFEWSMLSRPMLALAVGVLSGPQVLSLLDPQHWPEPHLLMKEAARLTLAMSVMAVALRVDTRQIRRRLRPVALLLTAGMLSMWAVSAGLTWAILGVSPVMALLIGAAVTPTDPVVASSIVTGDAAETALPEKTRSVMSLESGANDGLGYLLVLLPILLMTHSHGVGERWLLDVLLVGVLLAICIGGALGFLLGLALRRGDRAGMVSHTSMIGLSVALALLAVSAAKLAGSDGILASFAAGVAFNAMIDRAEEQQDENLQEAITRMFSMPVFVLLGVLLPWDGWFSLGWPALLLALAVLALRRPVTLALLSPVLGGGLGRRDKLFLGWFGPIGVAAIYYALHAREETGQAIPWHAVSLVIVASILAHGASSGPGLRWYRRQGG